jgi:UDP-N-acetylglucosamine transferase subunit ALG13
MQIAMVFATIGSSEFGFLRLIVEVDRLAGAGLLSNVVAQIGETEYEPRHCIWQRFLTPSELCAAMQRADFVICHAGYGALEEGMRHRKKIIAVPRRVCYKEAPDDHQFEIAHLLAAHNRILLANDIDELAARIEEVSTWTPSFAPPRGGNPIVDYIRQFIIREVRP